MPQQNSGQAARPTVSQLVAKPTHSYVHVTPEIAERWLRSNSINRVLRQTKINQYARDMREGRWTISNDDICFDPEGKLLNGQHRLHAVIASGATVLMGIKRNVPRSAMQSMDTGAARSAADVLRFGNEKNGTLLASTAKQLILIETGRVYQDTKQQGVSHSEIVEWLDEVPVVRTSVQAASSARAGIDAPPTALAVAHFLIAQVNGVDLADLYLDRLAEPISEPHGSAIHAVRGRHREVQKHRQTYPTRSHVYLLLKGWNYYAADKSVTKLQMAPKAGTQFRLPAVARWSR